MTANKLKVIVKTFGRLLFRDCDTFPPKDGPAGFVAGSRGCTGVSGIGGGVASILVCLTLLLSGSVAHAENSYIVREGEGIENVGVIGDDISVIEKALGKADRVAKEDMYVTDLFYEYHKQGVLVTADKFKKIKGVTLYANTGNKEQFHKTGLMWINPSSIYQTFQGATSKGLKFKDAMTPEDVYAVYGKPEIAIPISDNVQSKLQEGKPLIVDMGKAGSTIYYPEAGVSFGVFNRMVESCNITSKVKR